MGRPLRLLVIGEAPAAERMLLALRRGGLEPTWERVGTADGLRAALAADPWDAVLASDSVSGFGAGAGLGIIRPIDPDLPFIVVSGTRGEDAAVAIMRAGANDYILEHNLIQLAPAVERELRAAGTRRARGAAERATAHLAVVVESSDDAIISARTIDGMITTWNPAAERFYGWTAAEAIGRHVSFFVPSDKIDELNGIMGRLRAGERVEYLETVRTHRNGRRIDVALTVSPVRDVDGRLVAVSKTARDIRARKRAEEALQRSEECYRGVIESIPALVWVYDSSGRPVLHNRRWYEYTGQTPEDVADGRWHEALHPDDAAGARAVWARCMASGEPYSTEYRIRRADGVYRWFLAQGTAQKGPAGIERWGGICTDIEDRKRAEQDLRRTTDLLRAVADGTPDAIFVKDRDGRYLLFNPAAVRFVGRPVEAILGRDDTSLFGPEDARRVMDRDRRVMEVGATETEEEKLTAVGVTRTYLAMKAPYRDAAGHIIGVIGISRDITDQKRGEESLTVSETRYRRLFETARDGILLVDPVSRRVFDVNPFLTDLLGYTRDELVGKELWEIGLFRDIEANKATFQTLRESGYIRYDDLPLRTKDGHEIPVEFVSNAYDVGGTRVIQCNIRDISARKRAEEALRLRDRAIRAATQGLLITDPAQCDNPLVYVSPGFERITGYDSQEVLGRNCRFLQGKDTDRAAIARLQEAVRAGEPCTVEVLNYRKDGTPFWNELSISPVHDTAGRLTHFVGVQADVTARRGLEEQLRQVQKMEAVGQLAGGIAHDFNNLLTIINGHSDLLLQTLPPGDQSRDFVAEIYKAGERSAGLTRQLLAFSRQQVLAPRVLDLNVVVADTEKMLRRLIGEDIRLTTTLAPGLWAVRADPGQVEQVLMNLVVNARDAMPPGGRLTIETRNVELDEGYVRTHPDARMGPHILLSVSDTGSGMTPEVQARIFEPFFTTKGPGTGTGLGLATVYGIVKQSGGHVAVYSEIGIGTTFKVYLPWAEQPVGGAEVRSGVRVPPRGTETVLVAEDEDGVRALTRQVLTGRGYTVLEAADGAEAVRAAAEHDGPIHLLITDVVMPGAGGRLVAEKVGERHPETRVLFVSGYTDDAVIRHGVLRAGVNFLQKPFSPALLAFKVREVLDAPAETARPDTRPV